MIFFALGGCGGRQVVATKPSDISVPPELEKAFEVKEMQAMQAAPSQGSIAPVAPEIVLKKKSPKKKKDKKKKGSAQDVAQANASPQGAAGDALAGPGEISFQIPNRRPEVDPIWVGERVWMDVTWLNTKAGEFELQVLPFKIMNGRKVYDFKGIAKTSELFSLIYKAEDWVESFVDYEGWFPYKFVLHGDETKHIRNNIELFDHGAKKQYVHVHDNRVQKGEIHEEKGFKDLTPFSQDSLSAIYYVRTLKFEEGKTLRFPMTTNGSQWETEITVLGREEVNTKMGYLRAFKCKVETRFKGVLQQQGDTFMWFSDDQHKHLLRFEAKVRIGWVAGVAKKIELGAPEQSSGTTVNPAVDKLPGKGLKADPKTSSNSAPSSGKRRLWFRQLIDSMSGTKK